MFDVGIGYIYITAVADPGSIAVFNWIIAFWFTSVIIRFVLVVIKSLPFL